MDEAEGAQTPIGRRDGRGMWRETGRLGYRRDGYR